MQKCLNVVRQLGLSFVSAYLWLSKEEATVNGHLFTPTNQNVSCQLL